jgi:hypothetical protein
LWYLPPWGSPNAENQIARRRQGAALRIETGDGWRPVFGLVAPARGMGCNIEAESRSPSMTLKNARHSRANCNNARRSARSTLTRGVKSPKETFNVMELDKCLFRYRLSLGLFIVGLIASGLTLRPELSTLCRFLGISNPSSYPDMHGLRHWIGFVYFGLKQTYSQFPFFGYATDWLAFGHLVIAAFFVGPFLAPKRNSWVLYVGTRCLRGRDHDRVNLRTDAPNSVRLATDRLQFRSRRRYPASLLPTPHQEDGDAIAAVSDCGYRSKQGAAISPGAP